MTVRYYPTLRARRVGHTLREWREHTGLTGDAVATQLRWSRSKISKLESGSQTITAEDVANLATIYHIPAPERDRLVADAQAAIAPVWWTDYPDILDVREFHRRVDLETEATQVLCVEIDRIPELVQTADYARAIARTSTLLPDHLIEQWVAAGKQRQARVFADHPITFSAVISEAAIRQRIGGPEVMCTQLRHLARIAHLPHVSVQLMPLGAASQREMGFPFVVLRFDRPEWPDSAYLEALTRTTYIDDTSEVDHYATRFTSLRECALTEQETLQAIEAAAGDL